MGLLDQEDQSCWYMYKCRIPALFHEFRSFLFSVPFLARFLLRCSG